MDCMPMESRSQRWPTDVYRAVVVAAKHRGESPSQYIRIASLGRAAYDAGRRGDSLTERVGRVWDKAAELDRAVVELLEIYDLDDEG